MASPGRARVPARPVDVPAETWDQLQGFHWLEKIWDGFQEASQELSRVIGGPVCVENCGLCCVTNTPAAWGIEVRRAATWLWEQSPGLREGILDRIENWLLRPVLEVEAPATPSITIREPARGKGPAPPAIEVLACTRGRCPLLGPDRRCMVYPVRPLACRAWGITTLPARWCRRPAGIGEDDDHRAIFEGDGTARLRAMLHVLLEVVRDHPKLTNTVLFPTALYALFREQRLLAMLSQVPRARLVGGQNALLGRLFEGPVEVTG